MSSPATDISREAKELEKQYSARAKNFSSWYSLLKMDDNLAQKDMESFVGNDPRTTWNMAVYLLRPKPLTHKLVSSNGVALGDEVLEFATVIEQYFSRVWDRVEGLEARRGRGSWFRSYIGFLAATGWSAVPYMVEGNGRLFVDYWNPATVFPEFSDRTDDGLLRLARIRSISSVQAHNSIVKGGWLFPRKKLDGKILEVQLWKKIGSTIYHGVDLHGETVKPMSPVPGLTDIPVVVNAVGGLPDDGNIDSDFMGNVGQSVLATNAPLYQNFNKQQTFMQQLLRDTANPRVLIKSQGDTSPVNPDDWYKRGAFFYLGLNDTVEVVQQAGIPVELTSLLFSLRGQMQRGGFSDLTFGNVLQEVTGVLVTQAAEAAMQLLDPLHYAIQYMASTVTNFWYQRILEGTLPVEWPAIDKSLLIDTAVVSSYSVKIPGDLQNRVQTAKMLNPRLELPLDEVIEMFLPEVDNVSTSMAKLDGERAKQHPAYTQVVVISAFERLADTSRRARNQEAAVMFDTIAGLLRKNLTGEPTQADRLGTSDRSEAEGILPGLLQERLGG